MAHPTLHVPSLPRAFFARETRQVARSLLGARLVRIDRGRRLTGIIVEAEAYIGEEDQGCHARHGRTARNAVMFAAPGHAYVYFTYGMHWMLNVVTEAEGYPAAVLLRAIWPEEGVALMQRRRGRQPLADGPGKLCQALGIDGRLNGHDMCRPGAHLFCETGIDIAEADVVRGPRVGLNSVPEPWKSIPWRYRVLPEVLRKRLDEGHH
jgi:DNA-3-methyladenine glycosylase